MMNNTQRPKVAVLLAAYNGIQWIEEQVNTIFSQRNVDITLFISVDLSTDGTFEWAENLKKTRSNLILLPYGKRFGSATKNFINLILNVEASGFDYVSLSDQDDLWLYNKIISAIDNIVKTSSNCYASNLTCFNSNNKWLLKKSHKQKKLDYLFQGASAGCTYVLDLKSFELVKSVLNNNLSLLDNLSSHDWIIYAITRSRGLVWSIDSNSFIMYRQHESNVQGARSGFLGGFKKYQEIKSGCYYKNILANKDFILCNENERSVFNNLYKNSFLSKIYLATKAFSFRRKLSDSIILSVFFLLGLINV